jgi:hypothetical protein
MTQLENRREEKPLGELFADLGREVSTLVRQEAALAKAELGQKASRVGSHVASLAAGGAVAYAGLLAIIAAIIGMLAEAGLDWWVSALIVGAIVGAIGGFLVMKGINALKSEDLTPRQTLESLKEDAQWAQRQTT